MSRACSAAPYKLPAQRGAGTMGADSRVRRTDAVLAGIGCKFTLGQIDLAQQFGITRFERFESAHDTSAGGVEELWLRGTGIGQFQSPALQRRNLGSAAAVVVDDGIAQDAIEPGNDGLFFPQPMRGLECAHIGRLQDIFGNRGLVDASTQESEELAAEIEQCMECGIGHGKPEGRSELLPHRV